MLHTAHKLVITNPCSENWEGMSVNDRGRFCDACQKTVVDFTAQSDTQIKQFIASRPGEKMCGRFYKHQIDRIRIEIDPEIFQKSLPYWQKFLVILLVCFGSDLFGCDFVFGQEDTNSFVPKIEQIDSSITIPDSLSLSVDTTFEIVLPEFDLDIMVLGGFGIYPQVELVHCEIAQMGLIYIEPESETNTHCGSYGRPKNFVLPGIDTVYTSQLDSTKLPGIRSASEEKPQPAKKEEKSELPLLAVLNSEDRRKKLGGE